tara:strand:- start:668 stop:1444 length:777 start_codon:yes stop_codon:yes gene_type:complete
MASAFFYDKVDYYTSTTADGTITINSETGSTTFATSSSITNEEYIRDGSIQNAITNVAANDTISFDLGSAQEPRFIAYYFKESSTTDITLWNSASATGSVTSVSALTDAFAAGWTVDEISPGSARRYWFVYANGGAITNLSEIIMGAKFTLPVEPSVNIEETFTFGTDYIKAYGNNEYVKDNHAIEPIITFNLDYVTSAQLTNIKTFASYVTNRYPFIYSEDGATGPFHFVRLLDAIKITEVAPNIFSCTLTLREIVN